MKFCPYCGEALQDQRKYKFCPECGERLQVDAPEQAVQETDEQPADTAEEAASAPAAPDAYHEFIPPAPEPDVSAPHDAYREFAPPAAIVTQEEAADEPEEPEEPEVWIRPDGWTPEDEAQEDTAPRRAHKAVGGGKKRTLRRAVVAFLAALVLVGGGAGFAVLKLRQNDAPARAAQRFAESVYTGDTKYVLSHMETAGSGLTSAESVAAMCASIRESIPQGQLESHLLAMGDTMAPGYSEALGSLQMREVENGLFSQKFSVRVAAVPVLIRTEIDDASLYVDGARATPTPVAEGLLLELAPGRHELRAAYEEYGKEYELGNAVVNTFSSAKQEVTLTQNTASVAIELAGVESNLSVSVDGRGIHVPQNVGWLTLNPAFVGMQIELVCDEYTQIITIEAPGKQTMAVDYIETMVQQNPGGRNPEPAMLTNRQLAEKLGKRFYTCYRSYLEASNTGNEALIRDADENYKAALIRNMNDYNSGYRFDFKSIEVDYRSVTRFVEEDKQFATVRVEVLYNYTKRTGDLNWLAGFNRQDVTLLYDEARGDWLVYGSNVDDTLTLSEDTFTVT